MWKQNTQVCKTLCINKEQKKTAIEKHSSEMIYFTHPTVICILKFSISMKLSVSNLFFQQ